MAFLGLDPGDPNNWYQSPQLGLFPVSPAGYGGGISGACYRTHSSHPHGGPSYPPPPSQFSSQPNPYPPLQLNPSATIINGHLLPHQFPCVPQTHSQFFPPPYLQPIHPNTNLWIHPSHEPSIPSAYSQFVPTKSMITQPIYHSAPPPSAYEQPRLISYLKEVEPALQLHPISMEPDQIHKDQLEARISEKQDSFEAIRSQQSTFQADILAELRQLRLGPKNPVTAATSLMASGDTLTATAIAGGSIRISEPNFNLSPHEAILNLNNDISVVVVSGSISEDNSAIGMTDKVNIVSHGMGARTGNKEYEIQSAEGAVVTVKLIGKLRDGTKFLKKGHGEGEAPFDFKKNEEQVIKELEKTVVTMRKVLDEASLPSNFMDAIMDGVLCSIEAITCIPQCLYALCLNNNGFQAVKDALRCLVEIYTSGKYLRTLTNDKLGELMFHASSLCGPDVDMLIEILNAISNIGHRVDASLTSTALLSSSTPVPREADGEEGNVVMTYYRESSKVDSLEQGTEPSSDSLVGYAELLLPGCVSKVARLLETVLQNGDICLIMLEKKRIEAVLQLFTLPLMALSVTVSPSIPIAFKNFTPQHSASLAWVVCYTDYQSRSHLLQRFTLCFELCNCETTKEPPLSCRLIQTLVSRVFTTIISGPLYFRADFYEVLCDLHQLYVVIHNPFNDNDVNLLPDDTFWIIGSVSSLVVDMYAHFGASLIPEMEKQCEKECFKVYMLDSTQGHLILALETVHFKAACPWALWFLCLALPTDKYGFLTVFSSQFCDFILLKANPCQPTTWGQIVSLRFDTAVIYFIIGGMTHNNLNRAALPTAFWSPQMSKDIDQLQTHSTIIITFAVGVISENINDQTKAISQPRSFSIDEIIDFLQINLEFSSSRYSSDRLLSIGYGVVFMPNMHKFSQYMVGHVHKDDYFLATSSSNFYSSVHAFHALVRKLFPLSPMAAIRPLLVNIIREDAHCITGIMLVISMIELVSLKSKKQGFEIMYGDVSDGNYCSHTSCSLYILDFMITWFIEFGFVVIFSVDLALVPQNFFSVPMQSNEAPLLILIFRIIHSQAIEFVNSSHLLQGPSREALRVSATSHVGVHLCALMHNCVFKYYICLFASFISCDEDYYACVEGREIISHLSITVASKFLLNWLVQPEHEHRKWSAAISVRIISSGLHITDHKHMLEKCLGVVKSTLDALHLMQKSGIKQNHQSFLQSYLPYVSLGKAYTSLQHEHHIGPADVKTVISSVHQQEVPSSYSSVISQEGQHQMETVVTKLNVPADWKKWQIYLLLVGMFMVFAVAIYLLFEKSDNFWNFSFERYQSAGPEFGAIQKSCLLHNFCNYHINAPRHELEADVISSDFSLLNVDDLADQFVGLVDFLGLKKVLSFDGDLHDEAGTIWKIIQA